MTAYGFRTICKNKGGRKSMLKVNPNYEKLPGSYLFAEIARRVKEYTQAHPDAT